MRILVTRPLATATELAERLEALGHTVLIDPLLSVELLDPPPMDFVNVQAVAITSTNALQSLARHPEMLANLAAIPLFTVGSATTAHARGLGFVRIHEGPGDAAALASTIQSSLSANAGPLLYLRGETTAFDLARDLGQHGWTVQNAVVYRTSPARTLAPATLAALAGPGIDGVTLLSARTADTYARLIIQHNHMKYLNITTHYCLSDAIAQALACLGRPRIRVARQPKIEELLALVGGAAKCLP